MVFGAPKRFHKKFKFLVQIDGVTSAGFQKAGPLKAMVGVVKYREGGQLMATKDPGLVDFDDITLERGMTVDQDLHNWFKDVVDVLAETGKVGEAMKRHLDLVQQDRDGSEVARYRVFSCWPNEYQHGEWDNNAEEVVIESVKLTVTKLDRVR